MPHHSYTHADGSTSTRTDSRTFTWAVESIVDRHGEARTEQANAARYATDLEAFNRAVAATPPEKVITESVYLCFGRTRHSHYATDPQTGERYWIGSEVRGKHNSVPADEMAWDYHRDTTRLRRHREFTIVDAQRAATQRLQGPRYHYAIIRWSQRRESAEAYMPSRPVPHLTFNLVPVTAR